MNLKGYWVQTGMFILTGIMTNFVDFEGLYGSTVLFWLKKKLLPDFQNLKFTVILSSPAFQQYTQTSKKTESAKALDISLIFFECLFTLLESRELRITVNFRF